MMTKQIEKATTGVVAIVRAWSGTGAFAFSAAPHALEQSQAIRYTTPMNGTDLTPVLGARAWSPPV